MTIQRWRVVLWAAMLGVVGLLVWEARGTLVPFAFGAIIAYALSPIADRLAALVPVRSHQGDVVRRGFAVLLIYLVLGSILVTTGAWLVPLAVDQITTFIENLPERAEQARQQMNEWLFEYRRRVPEDIQERVDLLAEEAALTLANAATAAMQRTISVLSGTLGLIFGFAVVPFWMFYAIRDRHFVRNNFMNAVPEQLQSDVEHVLLIGDRLVGRYIRGQLFLGVVVGIAVGIGLTLLGVQLSLALGLWAGVTELIPILGPWIGAIPALVLVAATEPDLFIWVALLYIAVQQLENNLLVPRIQGHAVDLHPAMIILLLAVGGAAFGFLGLLFIVPLAAILRELFWYVDHRLRGERPEEAFAHGRIGRRIAEEQAERAQELADRAARTRAAAEKQAEVAAVEATRGDG